ncbi:interleukin-20 receptor subunit alpha-like isoform X2 [Mixophyes fleayi]|uniref:interleukin-20 receptor subunit alpha-like isoform X2 n=1 Tax=Mixophyes fleayi TaxID=3061075 RepID=UPI003F4D7557
MLLPLLLILLLPQSKPEIDCAPGNVTFMKNKITWLAPKNSEGIRYTVEYRHSKFTDLERCRACTKLDGVFPKVDLSGYDSTCWQQKLECTNITRNKCDLTNETSNSGKKYYGRVTASNQVCSKSKQTQKFNPRTEIKIRCAPRSVTFSSENLKNQLTWLPPQKSEGIHYTVEYRVYGAECWQQKLECTNINKTWCDLTNETTYYEEQYYGRVTASNQNCSHTNKSQRFKPLQDTILGPPTVNLFYSGASIEINLTHPVTFLHSIDKTLKYHININGEGFLEIDVPYYKRESLHSGTTYCVTAKVLLGRKSSLLSNNTCITTKADHTSEDIVKVLLCILPVVFLTFILFAFGYGVHKYIHVGNLSQPRILNITANKNNNTVLVEGHTVTINLITIDSGIINLQNTIMSGEEKTQNKSDLDLSDDGDDISHDSGVMEDDHGYVSLQELQVPANRPQLSPYDMPHHVVSEQARPLTAPLEFVHGEQDLYGKIKCAPNVVPLEEKNDLEVIQNAYTSERALVAYLPKNDHEFPKLDVLSGDYYPCELEESLTEQDSDNVDVTDDTDLSECGTLFVDWSPKNPHLRIPNLCNKAVNEFRTEECHEVTDGLLSQLYLPLQPEEASKEDELVQLMERWGLSIQM